ncbi:hypothetical protein ACG7TL_007840 [Trametes sanguinea]
MTHLGGVPGLELSGEREKKDVQRTRPLVPVRPSSALRPTNGPGLRALNERLPRRARKGIAVRRECGPSGLFASLPSSSGLPSRARPAQHKPSPRTTLSSKDGRPPPSIQVRTHQSIPSRINVADPHVTPPVPRNSASLIRRPMVTQCVTSAVLFGSGDIVAQQVFEKKGFANHDHTAARVGGMKLVWTRADQCGVLGAIFGPVLTKWLQFLERLKFSSPVKGVVYRVYLDQGVFTPMVVGMFFGSLTLLEGKSVTAAKERIKEAYVPTLIRNWGVFIPTQIVNFAIVPPHLRFVTVGVVSLFWNAYLSSVNAKKQVEIAPETEISDAKSPEALVNAVAGAPATVGEKGA